MVHQRFKLLTTPSTIIVKKVLVIVVVCAIVLFLNSCEKDCTSHFSCKSIKLELKHLLTKHATQAETFHRRVRSRSLTSQFNNDEDNCSSLVTPPSDQFTYNKAVTFVLSKRSYEADVPFKVVLVVSNSSKASPTLITSFMMQARTDQEHISGSFMMSRVDDDVALQSCNQGQSLNTAKSNSLSFRPRSHVTFYWIPDKNSSLSGNINFRARVHVSSSQSAINLSSYEIVSKRTECFVGKGQSYRGTAHQTVSGLKCQRWDSNSPHKHFTSIEYPDSDLTSNFCRNMDNDSSPWCYTTDPARRFEKCTIPECTENLPNFFYPFGSSEGDEVLTKTKPCSEHLKFSHALRMKTIDLVTYQVCENGLIVLNNALGFSTVMPTDFLFIKYKKQLIKNPALLAPFWSQIHRSDTTLGTSLVFFRQTSDIGILSRITKDVNSLLSASPRKESDIHFRAQFGLIVTWYLVGDSPSQATANAGSSFQAVLTGGKCHTFLLMNYSMKKWSKLNPVEIGYTIANVEYARVGNRSLEQADELAQYVSLASNVGIPGRWMLNVSSACQCDDGEPHEFICSSFQELPSHNRTGAFSKVHAKSSEAQYVNTTDVPHINNLTTTSTSVTLIDTAHINHCYSSPCNNDATCESSQNGFHCNCSAGFTGSTCSFDINECYSQPCLNGGSCIDSNNHYRCVCTKHWTGINCQLSRNGCHAEPCQNKDCPAEHTDHGKYGFILWVSSLPVTRLEEPCPYPSSERAYRICDEDGWHEPVMDSCRALSDTSSYLQQLFMDPITAVNAVSVLNKLAQATAQPSSNLTAYDIGNVATILEKVLNVSDEVSVTTVENILSTISFVLESPKEERYLAGSFTSSNAVFVKVIEQTALKVRLNGSNATIIQSKSIDLAVVNCSHFSAGCSFSLSTKLKISLQANTPDSTNSAVNISIPSSSTSKQSDRIVQFVAYKSSHLFQFAGNFIKPSNPALTLAPYVMSASLGSAKVTNLIDPIVIRFTYNTTSFPQNTSHCVYWEPPVNGGEGVWSTNGCVTEITSSDIICRCNHLTNFAVLLDIYGSQKDVPDSHRFILQVLTYAGSGLSILGLAVTLIFYAMLSKLRKEIPSKILMSLCVALMATNMFFLALQPSYINPKACIAVAICLHYSLLSSFLWMGLEGFNMYIALIRVFNTYYRRYLIKLSVVGWATERSMNMTVILNLGGEYLCPLGIPAVLVSISAGIHFSLVPVYIRKEREQICWLHSEVFYGTLVAPFAAVFLFNFIIFCLVLTQLLGIKSRERLARTNSQRFLKTSRSEHARKMRGAVGLMTLLGITWGLAFTSIGSASVVLSYAFIGFNATQGFWVFLFHCILKKDILNSLRGLCGKSSKPSFSNGSKKWSRGSSSSDVLHGSRSTLVASRTQSAQFIHAIDVTDRKLEEPSSVKQKHGIDRLREPDFTECCVKKGQISVPFGNLQVPNKDNSVLLTDFMPDRIIRRIPRPMIALKSRSVAVQTENVGDEEENDKEKTFISTTVDEHNQTRSGVDGHLLELASNGITKLNGSSITLSYLCGNRKSADEAVNYLSISEQMTASHKASNHVMENKSSDPARDADDHMNQSQNCGREWLPPFVIKRTTVGMKDHGVADQQRKWSLSGNGDNLSLKTNHIKSKSSSSSNADLSPKLDSTLKDTSKATTSPDTSNEDEVPSPVNKDSSQNAADLSILLTHFRINRGSFHDMSS